MKEIFKIIIMIVIVAVIYYIGLSIGWTSRGERDYQNIRKLESIRYTPIILDCEKAIFDNFKSLDLKI